MDEAAAAPDQDAANAKWQELDAFLGKDVAYIPNYIQNFYFLRGSGVGELQPEPGGQRVPGPRRHQRQQVLSHRSDGPRP